MLYFVKSPFWLRWLYCSCVWKVNSSEKTIYLTFDDGPHPEITPIVLDELKKYDAKATFFCIGDNVKKFPDAYKRIIAEGHAVANHTMHHLNGWKTDDAKYLDDIAAAKNWIDSDFFRPPYGRITRFQLRQLSGSRFKLKTVMWSVLSGDFDVDINGEQCLINVIRNTQPGSIVVFHDSEKAKSRMQFALPKVLAHFHEKGFRFEKLNHTILAENFIEY